MEPGAAVRPAVDIQDRLQALRHAHEVFRAGRRPSTLRPVIEESWQLSRQAGVDPDGPTAPVLLEGPELDAYRRDHRLASVLPVIEDLLLAPARESGLIVAVADQLGRLLWVEGSRPAVQAAERMNFVPGSSWAEPDAGTNAPGVSLRTRRPSQVFAAEHYSAVVHPWSCAAAPILDPVTGRLLGVLDLTGGPEVAEPATLALVRATVAALGAELRQRHASPVPALPRVLLLDRDRAALVAADRRVTLSRRHSEIVALLLEHPGGLSADRLDALLHESGHAAVTTRAEMSRLRSLLQPVILASRPYRLHGTVESDAGEVRRLVASGLLHEALAAYTGPLLPGSDAPGVRAARQRLYDELRHAILGSGDADLMLALARRDGAGDDVELWRRIAAAARTGSPAATEASRTLDRLDRDLG